MTSVVRAGNLNLNHFFKESSTGPGFKVFFTFDCYVNALIFFIIYNFPRAKRFIRLSFPGIMFFKSGFKISAETFIKISERNTFYHINVIHDNERQRKIFVASPGIPARQNDFSRSGGEPESKSFF